MDPATETIQLLFSDFTGQWPSATLAIFDGPDESYPRWTFSNMNYYMTTPALPLHIESAAGALNLEHYNPGGAQHFALTWSVVPRVARTPQCSGEVTLDTREGSMTSGWGSYYDNRSCRWIIDPFTGGAAGPEEMVTFHMSHIYTEAGYDYVRVHTADDAYTATFTGHDSSSCQTFQGPPGTPLLVDFYSDVSVGALGFTAEYTTEPGPALCPASGFFPATFSQAAVSGDRLVATTLGYATSEYRIAQGNPVAQTASACILPAHRHVPDPMGAPCTVELEACVLLDTLAACPDVSTEILTGPHETIRRWHVPLHALSTVRTGIDPNGEPVFGNRWQSMDILIDQTIGLDVSATVKVMHPVNFTGFEKGDSYFDRTGAQYVLHFSIWTNQPYTQDLTTGPWLESTTALVGPTPIHIERNPSADQNCDGAVDPTRFCERAFRMVIDVESTCGLLGVYRVGTHVGCADPGACPRDTEGDYFAEFMIVPGNCQATLINITVTGDLWVEMDGGTALAWGRRCTVMGQLHAQTDLAEARLHQLAVCKLPLAPGTTECTENPHQMLILDEIPTPFAEGLNVAYSHTTMLYNCTIDLDLPAFHYALGVDPNPNLITDLQFDAQWDSFYPGHVPGANRAHRWATTHTRTRTAWTGRQWAARKGRWATANGADDEDQGPLNPQSPAPGRASLTVTGSAEPAPQSGGFPTAAVAAGGAVGGLVVVGLAAVGVVALRARWTQWWGKSKQSQHQHQHQNSGGAPEPSTVASTLVTSRQKPVRRTPTPAI